MKHFCRFAIVKRYTQSRCLIVLALLLSMTGCSTVLVPVKSDSTAGCFAIPEGTTYQNAPDDCLVETCRDGQLVSSEDLTETAPVSAWSEETFCLFHPVNCFRTFSIIRHVRQWEQNLATAGFWDKASLQGGLGDAARHAYLACILTERFGDVFAKGLLNAHEEDDSTIFGFGTATAGNKCCDKIMDKHNNRIGLELAGEPGDCNKKVLDNLQRLRHSLCVK
jgi:hypothetical protein